MKRPTDYVDVPEALAAAISDRITSQAKVEDGDYAKVVVVFYRGELDLMRGALLGGEIKPDADVGRRSKAIAEAIVAVLTRHIPAYAKQDAAKTLAAFLRNNNMRFEVK